MANKPSNWHNKKVDPPRHGSCQTPECNGAAEKKYTFNDGGFAHFCHECWHKWIEKELLDE